MIDEIEKFWIVWIPDRGKPTRALNSLQDATMEGRRLAIKENTRAYVCECVGYAEMEEPMTKWVAL